MFCRYSRDLEMLKKKVPSTLQRPRMSYVCIDFHGFPRFMLSLFDVRLGPTIGAYLHSYMPPKLNISSDVCIN